MATPPEEYFGFQLVSDRKIARWDQIIEYFRLLERQSNKIKVVDMGPPRMAVPSSSSSPHTPRTSGTLKRPREVNLRLSDPRGLTDEEAEVLIREEKAVLIGFRAQHRAQNHGTFNLLFNSLLF